MDLHLARKVTWACLLLLATASEASPERAVGPAKAASVRSPIFGVTTPEGYRRWELIAPSHRPDFDELRGIFGNSVAMKAYRSGTLPFPDGTILTKVAWQHVPSSEFEGAFVPGSPKTVQIMVKDSSRYASTGGWGFGRFTDGVPASEAEHNSCYACHKAFVRDHDLVFTRYAK